MPNIVVVGTQWGDEGKGKVVDLREDMDAGSIAMAESCSRTAS